MAKFEKYVYDGTYEVKTLKDISMIHGDKLNLHDISFVEAKNKEKISLFYNYEVMYSKTDGIDIVEYILGYCDEIISIESIERAVGYLNKLSTKKHAEIVWNLLNKGEQEALKFLWNKTSTGEKLAELNSMRILDLNLITQFVVKDSWDNYALSYLGAYVYCKGGKQDEYF